MNDRKYFKCRVGRKTLEEFKTICEFFEVSMSEISGSMIKNFVSKNQQALSEALIAKRRSADVKECSSIEDVLHRFIGWLGGK